MGGQARVCYRFAVCARRPKIFSFSADVVRNDLVRRRKNFLRRTVVLFKTDYLRPPELLFKIEDIVYIRAHKAVNALVVVPDNANVSAVAEQADKLVLKRIGVLIFVHENIVEASANPFSDLLVFGKQPNRFKDQIVKVERVRLPKPFLVCRVNFGYFRERRIVAVRYVIFQLLGRLKSRFCGGNSLAHNSRRILLGSQIEAFYR